MSSYAVIGNPIEHSKSPQIHTAFAHQEGVEIEYQRILANEQNFTATVNQFYQNDGCGLNVTVPFKVFAFQKCAQLSNYAQAAKAVNTLSFTDQGDWIGANTDGIGLLRDLKNNLHTKIEQQSVLIVGAGGATRGILLPLLQERPTRIILANRTSEKAQDLVNEFAHHGTLLGREFEQLGLAEFDIIINATSASLSNEVPPIPPSAIGTDTLCYDLVYSDSDTAFLAWAKSCGATRCSDGLGMLIEQAAESYFIWRQFRPDTTDIFGLLRPK